MDGWMEYNHNPQLFVSIANLLYALSELWVWTRTLCLPHQQAVVQLMQVIWSHLMTQMHCAVCPSVPSFQTCFGIFFLQLFCTLSVTASSLLVDLDIAHTQCQTHPGPAASEQDFGSNQNCKIQTQFCTVRYSFYYKTCVIVLNIHLVVSFRVSTQLCPCWHNPDHVYDEGTGLCVSSDQDPASLKRHEKESPLPHSGYMYMAQYMYSVRYLMILIWSLWTAHEEKICRMFQDLLHHYNHKIKSKQMMFHSLTYGSMCFCEQWHSKHCPGIYKHMNWRVLQYYLRQWHVNTVDECKKSRKKYSVNIVYTAKTYWRA